MKTKGTCWATGAVCALALGSSSAHADVLEPGQPADLFTLTDVVTGLDQPTSFAFLPDGRMLITEKTGALLIADQSGATTTAGTFSVNTTSEQGLLDVILHPDFASNRLLIIYYSAAAAIGGTSLDRHRVVTVKLNASDQLDMSTEKILVRGLRGPANHDGGGLAIGPDGKLYIGVGDTGCNSSQPPVPPSPPTNYFATCLTNGNGKILRVNLDGSIPQDNPLVGQNVTACGDSCNIDVTGLPLGAAREDIWAWGFRNPWRFWFDPETGNLWVGDVGEVTYEEVDVIPTSGGGKHYGWPWREGGQGYPVSQCQVITPNKGDCVEPKYYCQHGTSTTPGIDGQCGAITGGKIVDSCEFPAAFRGRYFFADNARNWIATLEPTANRNGIVAGSRQMFATIGGAPVHLSTGPDGGVYYAVILGGGRSTVTKIFPKNPSTCPVPDGGTASGGATGAGGTTAAGGVSSAGGASAAGGTTAAGGVSSAGGASTAGGTSAAGGAPGGPDASVTPDGGKGAGIGAGKDDSGCGCHVASSTNGARGLALLGAAAVGLSLRRGRRRRR